MKTIYYYLKLEYIINYIMIEENLELQLDEELFDKFGILITGLNLIKNQIGCLQQNIKSLEKEMKKKMKSLKKDVIKNKKKGNKHPSGFAKPSKVTQKMCEFMNKKDGTEIARTEVTRALVSYIKANNLENDKNHKVIEPDEKLKKLLEIEDGQELTYFNIQKYMNKHFLSSVGTSEV